MSEYSGSESRFDTADTLYEAIKVKADYQEFELSGRRQNSFAGTMTMHKDWTGGWKVRQNTEGNSKPYLLRTTPEWSKNREEDSRWMLEDGVLQARSGWDDATPWMCIELGVDGPMQDLIVTCWVVKLWSETASLQKPPPLFLFLSPTPSPALSFGPFPDPNVLQMSCSKPVNDTTGRPQFL
ncbi:MAG: hypothetical protein LQ350_007689 [Teloschistes chrysophthalmus]|nr:MAG: hypothetical protein LQ350_007689 [Niorma chrysophthalma]